MAVEIVKTPAVLSWSRNPMLFGFRSDNLVQDEGLPSISYLIFDWWGSEVTFELLGKYFTLVFDGVSEQFLFVDDPDDSGNQLPAQTSETDPAVFLENLIPYFLKNTALSSRYDVSWASDWGQVVIVFAEKENKGKNISMGPWTALEVFFFLIQEGVATEYTVNLRVLTELYVYVNGTATRVLQANLPTDGNGEAQIDVSIPVTDVLRVHGMDDPVLATADGRGVLRYYVSYREVHGRNQVMGTGLRTGDMYAVLGGVATQLQGQSVTDTLMRNGVCRWLVPDWGTEPKKIMPGMPTWLSWVNVGEAVAGVSVRVEVEYDGDLTYVYDNDVLEVDRYGKVVLATDMVSLEVAEQYPDNRVLAYSVGLWYNGDWLSDRYRYVLDNRSLPYARVFGFINSFGSFDTWYSTGVKSSSYEIEKQTARLVQVSDLEVDFDISVKNRLKINTGWKSRAEIRALKDFFASSVKYMLDDGRWWPINVATNSIEEFTDGNNLYALAFEVTGQHLEEVWGG